jgi:hypothetical protein
MSDDRYRAFNGEHEKAVFIQGKKALIECRL